MSLGCEATAGAVILKQLEIACFRITNFFQPVPPVAVGTRCHRQGGLRWSEDGPVKDDGLRPPLARGAWGEPVSASEKQLPHLPLLSGFPEKEVAGGGL